MFTVLILTCAIINTDPRGCGPGHNLKFETIGTATSEGECFMLGNKNLSRFPDTDKVFHKVICMR